jgi:chorismate-pyruvate lyase
MTPPPATAVARARRLIGLFCPDSADFGAVRGVAAAEVPPGPRQLLDHHSHMTVAMERFHGGPVGLRVVAEASAPPVSGQADWYAREILLTRGDGRVVQFGIVRIDLAAVPAATAAAIRAGRIPIGRILIAAGMLCEVQAVQLVEVLPGPHLATLFGPSQAAAPVHGRVADILLAGRPAVELLEIVAPA